MKCSELWGFPFSIPSSMNDGELADVSMTNHGGLMAIELDQEGCVHSKSQSLSRHSWTYMNLSIIYGLCEHKFLLLSMSLPRKIFSHHPNSFWIVHSLVTRECRARTFFVFSQFFNGGNHLASTLCDQDQVCHRHRESPWKGKPRNLRSDRDWKTELHKVSVAYMMINQQISVISS